MIFPISKVKVNPIIGNLQVSSDFFLKGGNLFLFSTGKCRKLLSKSNHWLSHGLRSFGEKKDLKGHKVNRNCKTTSFPLVFLVVGFESSQLQINNCYKWEYSSQSSNKQVPVKNYVLCLRDVTFES